MSFIAILIPIMFEIPAELPRDQFWGLDGTLSVSVKSENSYQNTKWALKPKKQLINPIKIEIYSLIWSIITKYYYFLYI